MAEPGAPGEHRLPPDGPELFALLAQAATEYAIFTLNTEGVVTSWNPGAERVKGYKPDEIIGEHFRRFYPPEDAERGKPERLLAAAIAHGSVEDEGWRVRNDGSRFWANVVITALRAPDGTLRGFGKVTRDLTERKRNEDALREVIDRERLVTARLRAMDKTKDEILSVVAHDLRGPFSVVSGLLQMLDDNWDSLTADDKHASVRRMAHSMARLRGLVDDVMDVTRIDTGDLRYELAAFDPDALAVSVVADVAGEDAPRVRVEPTASGSARAWGDERRAWQVLANLVTNALKFSPAGAPVLLRVIDTVSGEVHFAVEDRGPGVPADEQHRIFEKFSRVNRSGGGASDGTGLGLYIAQSLAHGQGGRILIDSDVGVGSTFTFVLPKAGGDVQPVPGSGGSEGAGRAMARPPVLRSVDGPQSPEPRATQHRRRRRSVARAGKRAPGAG
ncbi:MAG: PAS domain S-box protein [Acidimicrobiia bacterium]|nr:PAS domain S-box protein [Acidimicrobiia bacterium]